MEKKHLYVAVAVAVVIALLAFTNVSPEDSAGRLHGVFKNVDSDMKSGLTARERDNMKVDDDYVVDESEEEGSSGVGSYGSCAQDCATLANACSGQSGCQASVDACFARCQNKYGGPGGKVEGDAEVLSE